MPSSSPSRGGTLLGGYPARGGGTLPGRYPARGRGYPARGYPAGGVPCRGGTLAGGVLPPCPGGSYLCGVQAATELLCCELALYSLMPHGIMGNVAKHHGSLKTKEKIMGWVPPPPPPWTDRLMDGQTRVKTLPSLVLRTRAVIIGNAIRKYMVLIMYAVISMQEVRVL